MKNNLLFLISLLLFENLSFGQKLSGHDSLSTYAIALKQEINYLVDGKYYLMGKPNNSEPLYIDATYQIEKQLPSELAGFKIKVLSKEEILNYTQKREIFLLMIDPISLNRNIAEVTIKCFTAKQFKKRLFYGRAGRSIAKFTFNCPQDKFELSDIERFDQ